MSLYKKQWLCVGVMVVGIFLALLSRSNPGDTREGLAILGCLMIGAGIALELILVRCPHCNTWIGRYPGEFCRNCGKELPWDEK